MVQHHYDTHSGRASAISFSKCADTHDKHPDNQPQLKLSTISYRKHINGPTYLCFSSFSMRFRKVTPPKDRSSAIPASSNLSPSTPWMCLPTGQSGLGCSWKRNSFRSLPSTAENMSSSVMSSSGRASRAPPTPASTCTRPACFSCPNVLRMMTGFTLTLPDKNSDVSLYCPLKYSRQSNIWTAMGRRDENCLKNPPVRTPIRLASSRCNVNAYNLCCNH